VGHLPIEKGISPFMPGKILRLPKNFPGDRGQVPGVKRSLPCLPGNVPFSKIFFPCLAGKLPGKRGIK